MSRAPTLVTTREQPLPVAALDRDAAAPHLRGRRNLAINRLDAADRPAHDWYRFVLSYPPHLVRHYLDAFGLDAGTVVLDPFCGTGTTLVEAKQHGIPSVGIEANPMAALASRVKTTWDVDPLQIILHAERIAAATLDQLACDRVPDPPPACPGPEPEPILRTLPAEAQPLILANSISPRPLHKALVLIEAIDRAAPVSLRDCYRVALAKTVVAASSNLHFGPEVGIGKLRQDAAVVTPWLAQVRQMAADLPTLAPRADVPSTVIPADARSLATVMPPASIAAVITSPPYPNEKDYTRATRLETVLLGLARTRGELQAIKRGLVRSNTRGIYRADTDDQWIADHPEILALAAEIERRRLALGKTSGFERMYHRVTRLYFGGMARHLAALRPVLRPGAHLAYVVGDQASYLRVLIRTGELLAQIGESLGYERVRIDLFRTRLATATRQQLREEVVVLRWPG